MYQRSSQGWLKHYDFILLDLVSLQISYFLAYVLRHGFQNPYLVTSYRNLAIVLTFIEIITLFFFGTMSNVLKRGYYKEFAVTVKQALMLELFASFYLVAVQEAGSYSRVTLFLTGGIFCILSYIVRLVWKHCLTGRMQKEGTRSLLIVTVSGRMSTVISNIKNNNYEYFRIAGVVLLDQDLTGQEWDGVPIVSDRNHLLEYACREWIDEVFFDIPESEPYPQELIDKFSMMGIAVHMKLMKSGSIEGRKQFVERLGSYTVLTTTLNYATPLQSFLKRTMDIAAGLAGCLATLVLAAIIGPVIKIQSPGRIFFSQERIGKNGRRFKMYKFRSMYPDAEQRKQELMDQNRVKDGMMFKLDWDPRIIGSKKLPDGTVKKGIGNYIRDWSLDEFPQFFNVLKGDMSLVGTRPPTVDEWEKYELHHRARLAIRPGITGMWQVSGRSNITDFEEVVRLDTQYICNWSMGLDFKIIFKTVAAIFKKDGAM